MVMRMRAGMAPTHGTRFAVVAWLGLLATGASARDTLIDAGTPYSNGVVAIEYLDTVSFTTGIRLWSATICAVACDERSVDVVGFLGVSFSGAGMRSTPGAEPGRGCFFNGIAYSPTPDTTWCTARMYPDSLVLLDTVDGGFFQSAPLLRWPELVIKEWLCRWVGCAPVCEGLVPDWSFITYARCPDSSRMAFQFANDTVVGGPSGRVVRWAVDSAGNGLFRTGVTAAKGPRCVSLRGLPEGWDSRAFDMRGRMLRGEQEAAPHASPLRVGAATVSGGRVVWRE